ncbi:cupin domain-containing protein [Actibacterium sp. D379-3]
MTDPLILRALLKDGWRDLDFVPFSAGVEAYWLRRADPQMAVLRYAPGAAVPRHRHIGLETILVLDGVQSDDRGTYVRGDLVLNPAGSEHRVWSDTGCVVLLQWEKPVQFLG